MSSRSIRRPFRVAAVVLIFFACAGAARSESVLLEPFFIDAGKPMSCDAHEILSADLQQRGCLLWQPSLGAAPDVAITGDYEEVGGVGWLTLRAFDAVVGRVVLGERLYIPKDPWLCRTVVRKLADKILSPPFFEREKRNYLDGPSGIEFILVPGGSFREQGGRGKLITVQSFFISRYEITQAQWERVMGENPSTFTGNPDRPVESVSWYDVRDFIERLQQIGRQPYRLPTELEWEYAAQTRGRGQRWSGTTDASEAGEYAWTSENATAQTHPVGQKRANGLGLYDMSGNVWEWCDDWHVDAAGSSAKERSQGPKGKVIRGGSWMVDNSYATTSSREKALPESRSSDNGFRLVLSVINKN